MTRRAPALRAALRRRDGAGSSATPAATSTPLKKTLEQFLDDELAAAAGGRGRPSPTPVARRPARRAARGHARADLGQETRLTGANVLVAIFAERDSPAVAHARRAGRHAPRRRHLHLARRLEDGPDDVGARRAGRRRGAGAATTRRRRGRGAGQGSAQGLHASNLNEEAAEGRIDPLVGRANEVERTIQILARRRKNNPLLVGDAGVGKTAIVEGLALEDPRGRGARRRSRTRPSTRSTWARSSPAPSSAASSRSASRASSRRSRSSRARSSSSTRSTPSSAPARPAAARMDASNLLKPALASGKLRCIGSTTFQEYRGHFERDRALARRFQQDRGRRADRRRDDRRSSKGLQPRYEEFHGVTYTDEAHRGRGQARRRATSTTGSCPTRPSTCSTRRAPPRGSRTATATWSTIDGRRARGRRKMAQIPPRQVSTVRQGAAPRPRARRSRGVDLRAGRGDRRARVAPSSSRARACARPRSRSAPSSSPAPPASARPSSPSSSPRRSASSSCAST